jgi:diguanylate cyclase (GGDEF)-like protein
VASGEELSAVLSEFARTMVTDFPIQGILERLVERIVEILPITAAGVTLISPGADPRYVAASNGSALVYEQLQTELAEGPCLAAYRTGEAVSVPDMQHDDRFRVFGPRAVEAGLRAVFTFPLRQGDKRLGALDLYRETPGTLSDKDMAAAQTLADVTAAYLVNAQARDDLNATSERSYHNSMHDPLTGLPNRVLLIELISHGMLRGRRTNKMVAVLFVDLDGFKAVNDLHGHRTGDQLLVALASRLTGLLRPSDTLARISGDEFVILCEDLDDESQAEVIAKRLVDAMAAPFTLKGIEVTVSGSVGLAFAAGGEQNPEQLLADADVAMYQAKRAGGGHHQIIDLRQQHLAENRESLQRDLQGALRRGELRTEYQPIVRTHDGVLLGVEALLRWDHPSRGAIPPMTLVPLAEQTGLIASIGHWVLEQACTDRLRWGRETGSTNDLGMAVNVSANQLMAPDFASTVAEVLASTGTKPALLTLEITESVFIRDSERALTILNDLKQLGVMLALDDFGTGYSSLIHLHRFPIDVVKIDRSFIADLARDRASFAIVAKVIELAHMLDMAVVSEGVETVDQLREVATLGTDSCQGYYFARPMSADSVETLTKDGSTGVDLRLPIPSPLSLV